MYNLISSDIHETIPTLTALDIHITFKNFEPSFSEYPISGIYEYFAPAYSLDTIRNHSVLSVIKTVSFSRMYINRILH